MKVILALLLASVVFASGCIGNQDSKINYKGVDGKIKTIDVTGKTYQQICGETFGTWMTDEDGMSEMRNGKASGEPCSGCMTDNSNMFCSQEDYLRAIEVK